MNGMDAMQKSLFIECITARKENLKLNIEDAKKQSKDLNVFQTYQKGMMDGIIVAIEEEIKTLETYLEFIQSCENEELQKTLH